MSKLGLRENESLLAMGTVTKGGEAINIHDNQGDLLADFLPWQTIDTAVGARRTRPRSLTRSEKYRRWGCGSLMFCPYSR